MNAKRVKTSFLAGHFAGLKVSNSSTKMMNQIVFGLIAFSMLISVSAAQSDISCGQIFATSLNAEDKQILCKLYQSTTVLSQLSLAITDQMDRFIGRQLGDVEGGVAYKRLEKRKHEYLRFGRK